jgi:hypothetical protein
MTAEQIAEMVHGRPSGAEWLASCPGSMHKRGDKNPSLSIRQGERGALVHCFTGCSLESICEALRIRVADLFSEPRTPTHKLEIVRHVEKQIADLRSRLTPRERVLPITIVTTNRANVDAAIARALALAVEGQIVQCVLEDHA